MTDLPMSNDPPKPQPALPPHHVVVDFGSAIPADDQAGAMMSLEKWLRQRGLPAEVFKKTMQDDSKLRSRMTPEERDKL